MRARVDDDEAKQIQALIDGNPGSGPPRQIIIPGAVGSGRTGLGNDMAFKNYKVRYMAFDDLLEINEQFLEGRPLPLIGT